MWGLRSAAQAWFIRRIDTVITALCCVGRILAATGEQYKAAKPDEAVEDTFAPLRSLKGLKRVYVAQRVHDTAKVVVRKELVRLALGLSTEVEIVVIKIKKAESY